MKSLFRRAALKHIHSPEELDSVIKLAMPIGWMSVIIIIVLFSILLLWGLFGHIPFRVQGMGVIYNLGGRIYEVSTMAEGIIDEMYVKDGSTVQKGQIIATLSLPEVKSQLDSNRALLSNLQNQMNALNIQFEQEYTAREQNNQASIKALTAKIKADQQQYEFFDGLYQQQLDELKKGYITKTQAENSRVQRDNAMVDIQNSNAQIESSQIQLLSFKNQHLTQVNQMQQQVVETQGQIEQLETTLSENTFILSPTDGVVTTLSIKPNMQLTANQQVAIIEEFGEELTLLAYFDIADGKRIVPGMSAQVAPLSVEVNHYGTINAGVTEVYALPETQASLLANLENDALVQQLLQAGPLIRTTIALDQDDQTMSGLAWSSKLGPPIKISAGTTASTTVTLYQQRPIELVLPFFRAWYIGGSS